MKKTFGFFIGLLFAAHLTAQTSMVTSVSVMATDPVATEPGPVPMNFVDTGLFTITRQGPTNLPLTVFFSLSGTASNGLDYFEVTSPVHIPEGQRFTRVQIAPKHDELVEGEERVVLRLVPSPLASPGSDDTIWSSNNASAVVVIRDPGTNAPPSNAVPVVTWIQPTNGSAFPAGIPIFLRARATDTDGTVSFVDFFAAPNNGLPMHVGRSSFGGTNGTYTVVWSNAPAGTFRLHAQAVDNAGGRGFSDSVQIVVGGGTNQPPTNVPPAVQIVRPSNGEVFQAPAEIDIIAHTVDHDGWVPKVEFFANGSKIGESILTFIVAPPDGTPISHEFTWKDVRVGEYLLTARATDDEGAMRTSLPVQIFVRDSNAPPRTVVSIVATDPEGSEIPEVPPGMERPQLIDPAIFTVSRTGIISNALTVYYFIGGTASNGVDYVEIPRQVEIPAGARSADIEINVIDDLLAEGTENVVIQLIPPICPAIFPPPPECYVIGGTNLGAINASGRAEARILDNDIAPSNRPPVISIVVPTNGAVFKAPADIHIIAQAFDLDGYVQTVEFFAGTNRIGVATNNPFSAGPMNPFQITWNDVPPGQYMLTALATDDRGAQSRSRPVWITVVGEPIDRTVVNIRAVDPEAAEQDPRLDSLPNNALLRVTRSGPTDFDLPVYYRVDGTAENGVDYVRLSETVLIPKGSESADIVIEAIDDKLVERTESVAVALHPPACIMIFPPPPECYVVGSAGRANAFILDDEPFETNAPPHVEITQPSSGATFRAPADIHIVAKTVDRDGYVGKVEFFANFHKIGEASKLFLVPPPDGEPIEYDFDWKDVPPGNYALTARAIDDNGASGFSTPVRISVVGTNPPPPTNVAVVTVYATDGYASEGGLVLTNDPRALAPYGTNVMLRYTNIAVFEIRREGGNLDLPLRVFYESHGTASEGVDYLDLPGIVEIVAGQRAARVVIWPIDDQVPEKLESVVLCLRPSLSMSILPTYVVGRPGSAAAVIADNDSPHIACLCLRDGVFHWATPATSGQCYRIECSSDLRNWTSLGTVLANDGAAYYTDAESMAHDRRFYRAVPVPCPTE